MFNRSCFNSSKFNSVVGVGVITPVPTPTKKGHRFFQKKFRLVYDIVGKKAIESQPEVYKIKGIRKISYNDKTVLYAKRQIVGQNKFEFTGIKHTNFVEDLKCFGRKQFAYNTQLNLNAQRSVKLFFVRDLVKVRHQKFSENFNLQANRVTDLNQRYELKAVKQAKIDANYSIQAKKDITNLLEILDLLD